jgi:ethanolamine utilization protein EutA
VETGRTVLNIDIGGGTAKLAIARGGKVLDVAATDVGARLVTFDDGGVVTKVEHAAGVVAKHLGLSVSVGAALAEADKERIAESLATALLETAARRRLSPLSENLLISAPLSDSAEVDTVIFSGGVAEYLQNPGLPTFGDLGPLLAEKLGKLVNTYLPGVAQEAAAQRIRATVIGASQFTAQVSGNTIHIGNHSLLPVRNMPVVSVELAEAEAEQLTAEIGAALVRSEIVEGSEPFAITLRGRITPSYERLRTVCDGIAGALSATVAGRRPIFLVIDSDIARLVGRTLSDVLGGYRDIVCIDGIQLQDFDYIDIGEERAESGVVTVVIKSLVFTG